jgi:nucleotide-binding universal stress UspA family protein
MDMKILACTDGLQLSTWAVHKAAKLAKRLKDANVFLVHVDERIGSSYIPNPIMMEIPPDLEEELVNRSRLVLKATEKILEKEGVSYTAHLLEGSPAESILDFIEEHNIDLVFVGHTGRRGLERVFMGSVSSAVVQQAKCDVYVVKREL